MSTANMPSSDAEPGTSMPLIDSSAPAHASRFRVYAVLAPLLILIVLWLYILQAAGAFSGGPSGKTFGADYTMFVAAAQVLKSGGDPYDPAVLLKSETAMMHRLHRSMIARKHRSQVRVGNPPLLYWAMRPLTTANFAPAALASLIALYVLSAIGFLAVLQYFGWKNKFAAMVVFVFLPPVFFGPYFGNVIGIVFAATGISLLVSRRYPAVAGVVMSIAWLKPPVALPVVLLMALFHVRPRVPFVAGFAAGTAVLFLLTLVTSGWHSLELWVGGLLRYSNDMALQPDVISLNGLYVRWMPSTPRLLLEFMTLIVAVLITVYVWRTRRADEQPFAVVAPLWVLWMLASPYGHYYDEILLAIPLVAYFGPNGRKIVKPLPAITLYLIFFSMIFLSWVPGEVYLLPIPLLLIGAFMSKDAWNSLFRQRVQRPLEPGMPAG